MRSTYRPVPPVPRRAWHLAGPALGAAVVTAAGVALETTDVLPAPVVAPPVLAASSVVEILAIAAATLAPLLLAWRRPVGATVLQAVAAVVLVVVASIEPWGLAGPAVALAVAVGLRTAQRARAHAFATWPRTASAPLDDAARRAVDHGARPAPFVTVAARVLAVALVALGLVWTGVDAARTHAFRTDPATLTTTGTVLELLDDDLYARLDVDGTPVTVEILTAPPAIGAELPVRVSATLDRAELLGTPFDPAGALFWAALGLAVLVALHHRAADGPALAAAARGAGSPVTLVRDDDGLRVLDPDGHDVGRLDTLTLLLDPDADAPEGSPATSDARAEAEQIHARLATLSEREADELDDDELLEVYRAGARLDELDDALDPALEAVLAAGARSDATIHVVPTTGEAVLRVGSTLLRSVVGSPLRPAAAPGASSASSASSASGVDGTVPEAPGRGGAGPTGPLAAAARWAGDLDGLPMLAVHAVLMGLAWWVLDGTDSPWWDAARLAVVPAYVVHVTWLVRPTAAVGRVHLHVRERLRVQRVPWRDVTGITAQDDTVIVRTRTDGTSDAIVLGADPRSALVPLARCRDAAGTAERLRRAWAAGKLLAPTGPRWVPSLPLLLGCAWAALLVASALV